MYTLCEERRDVTDGTISNFSVATYLAYYRSIGCNPSRSFAGLLEQVRRSIQPTEENVDAICRWFMQLSYELGQNEISIEFESIYELANGLDDLLELAIKQYS
jgi:hypothetical protein